MKKCVRRNITLIEVMIVMFLIALIIGAVAYNYQGATEKGRAFKTETGMKRLEEILTIALLDTPKAEDDLESNWEQLVRQSPLVSNPNAAIYDGWGNKYDVTIDNNGQVKVTSQAYDEYLRRTKGS